MTFEEYLKSIDGLTDEQISAIVGGMKRNELYISTEENIDERYGKLKEQHGGLSQQLKDAQELIGELKPKAEGSEDLQAKIAGYEQQAKDAEARAAKAERDAALKVELLKAGAVPEDVDYLLYRIDNGDADVSVGEDGKLAGVDDALTALKAACPKNFEAEGKGEVELKPLPGGDGDEPAEPHSLEEALRQTYENKE